ncbi:MAG: hypothetical protein R8J41_05475 [Alphaproteobacteria bacterium]|nr:hypothetical protein [Alphaproteobacteria bacterium]
MADGQETNSTPTPKKDSDAAEAFRLDSANATARDEAVERARDYGSLDVLQGESDPANPNIHTGTRVPIDPGTSDGVVGAPDTDASFVGSSITAEGTSTSDNNGNLGNTRGVASFTETPVEATDVPPAATLENTDLDDTLTTGISTLEALTDRIARLADNPNGGQDSAVDPQAAAAQDASQAPVVPENDGDEEIVNRPPTDILLDNAGVVENAAPGTVVAVLSAIDPDSGEVFTYEIVGSSDMFEIVGNAVLVKEGAVLDHEALASVDLPLRVTDSSGNVYFETVTLDIVDVNEVATDIALDATVVTENAAGAVIGTLSTTDQDAGDTHTYAVSDDRFEVVGGQLKLKDGVALDHEAADTISIDVTTTDAGGLSYTETFSVVVDDINEVATDITLDNTSVAENAAGAVVGTLSTTDPDAGDTHSYSVSDARFEVVDGELKLKDGVALDHEAGDSVSIDVTTTDAGGLSRTETFNISVGDVNEVATDIALDNTSVSENAAGAVIGNLSTTDVDDGDTHSYAVSDARFEVVDGQLKLKDGVTLDHEAGDSVSIDVTTTDAGGLSRTETFNISVGDVNEVATDISLDNTSVAENAAGAVIGNLSTTDVDDGDTHSYAVSDTRFEVVDGQLKLKDGVALDHEAGDSVAIDVTTTDAGGLSRTETFNISVGDVNEVATDIALDNASVAENVAGAVIGNLSTTDVDDGDTHSYAVSDARFEVVDGQLKLKDGVTLDHEAGDSVSIDVTTTDAGGLSRTETFNISVGDENEVATDIALDNTSVAENAAGAVVGALSTTDVDDGDTHTYTVSDARFEVVDGNLKLKDGVSLDHETTDSVSLDVTTTDAGGLSRTESFTISVGDVNEAPMDIALDDATFAPADFSGQDGDSSGTSISDRGLETDQAVVSISFTTADNTSGAQTLFETGGSGTGLNIVIEDGQLNVYAGSGNNLELSVPIDGETSYNMALELDKTSNTLKLLLSDDLSPGEMTEANSLAASKTDWTDTDWDGGDDLGIGNAAGSTQGNTGGDFLGTIDGPGVRVFSDSDLNDVIQLEQSNASINENDAGAVVGDLSTTDVDAGDTHTYTVSDNRFEVVDGQLKLKDGVSLDHETESTVSMDVTTTDSGGLTHTETFTIAIDDVNEAPVDITLSDPDYIRADYNGQDGDSSSDSISDRGLETDSAVVAVSFTTSEDTSGAQTLFETGGGGTGLNVVIEDGQLNVYAGSGNNLELSVPIDGATSYNLALELDKASNTLKLLLSDELSPGDMTEANSLVASKTDWNDSDWDGGDTMSVGHTTSSTQGSVGGEFLGTIDGPGVRVFANADLDSIKANSVGGTVDENDAGAVVGKLSTTDVDAGDSHSYSVSDARFEVVGGQLKLKDGVSLDHETAESVSIDVTTTDAGGLSHTETFTVTVGDANEVATDISLDNTTVAENAAGAVVGTLSTTDVDDGDTHSYAVSDNRFEVVDGELKLKDGVSLDHEAGDSVSIDVTTTDAGGLSRTETFNISVGDLNEVATDIALDNTSVAENAAGAVIGNLSTTDVDDGDTHSYAVSDNRFEVVDGQLKLKDGVALDHESGDSVSINVTTTDAGGLSRTETFNISVGDENEVATDIALDNTSIAENAAGAVVGTLSTTDVDDGDTHTYSVSDARFEVVDGNLKLKDGVSLDHEAGDSISLDVTTTDAGGLSRTESFDIAVGDVNEVAADIALDNTSVAENAAGAVVGTLSTTDADDGDTHSYAVSDNRFEVVDGELKLKDGVALDHEAGDSISIDVTTTDAGGLSRTETFNISVGDVNEVATDIALDNTSVAENAAGAVVGTLSTTDADDGDTHSYSVSDARFEVVDGELKLKDGVSLDHEAGDSVSIDVTTTDAGGLARTETFSISVGDENEVATDIALDNTSVAENAAGAVVGTLSTTDVDDGDTHSYSVSDARFEVVDGELKLKDGVSLDHEAGDSVSLDVTTTDAGGLSRTETFNISVGDANEVATDISLDNTSVAENAAGAVVGTLSTTDVDDGDTHSYAVSDARFEVVDGELKLKDGVSLDHEAGDSVSLDVTTTDAGGLSRTETFSITVGDVNEVATDIALDNTSVAENAAGAVVGTLSTTDADDGDTHSYSVSDARFEVVDGELKLKDGVSLDHEAGDSISIDVTTTDAGGLSRTESFDIAVGDVNEVATDIALDNTTVAENNAGAVIGNLATTDPDAGDTHSYSVSDARFEVVDGQLKLKDGVSLDSNDAGTVSIDVTTTDAGGLSRTESFDIAVSDVNEAATDISLDNTSVAENAAGAVVGTLSTTDADVGDTHTYTVSDARFEVVDGELKLKDGVSLDHEAGDSIAIDVTTTDAGGLSFTESFDIAVGDVNEVATDISLDNTSVAENAAGAVVGTLSTTDVDDGDTHSYSVSDARFEVVDGELKLKDGVSLDHEAGDSVSIDVTTTDAGGLSRTETFSISVGDVNEVATDIALDNTSVAENAAGAVVGTLSTTDVDDSDTHSYSVSDSRFEVVDGELKLKDGVSLDHEAGDSVSLDVTTTDAGGLSRTETFTISVGDENEVATDISLDNTTVAENAAGAVVGTLSTTDADDGDTHSYAVSDNRFEVVDGELKLKDGVSLDHEAGDSISIDVTTTDAGGLSRTESFDIAVGDVNEVATDISLDNTTVAENAAGAVVGTLSTTDVDDGDTHSYAVSDNRFEVVDGELKLKDGASLDHEAGDSISIDVTTTDAGGLARTETFNISVGDENEVATDIALDNTSVAENAAGAVVGTLSTTDADDGDTHSYSVSDTRFEVVDGELKLKDGVSLDHEAGDSISIDVTTTDAGGLSRTESFDIAVGDVNEVATDISLDNTTVAENAAGAVVGTLSTTDVDDGDTHSYSVSDTRFEVVDGELKLKDSVSLDHEAGDSVSIDVTTTDAGGLSRTETFNISVGDENEVATDISLDNTSVAENAAGAVIGNLSTTDVDDGDTHSYSVSDARFEVVDGELKLKDGVSLDHEAGDSVSIDVTTTDAGGLTRTETFSITVGDENEVATDISLDNTTVAENAAGAVVGNLSTTDVDDGDTHSYAVSDNRFEVIDGELKLKDGVALDHEAGDSVSIDVTTTDAGGLSRTETFNISVGDVNEVATDISLDNTSVAENAAGAVVGTLSTTDADDGDTHSYAVSDNRFEVVDGELKLKDGVALDHEAGDSVSIDVTTTDAGGLSRTETFNISVGDVNEVATDISLDNTSVAENAAGAVIGNLSTTDVDDGDTHSYSVSDTRFEVVDGELKLKDGVSLDHEANATVSIDVTTTDAGGLSRTETFNISVGDVDEVASAPTLDVGSTTRTLFSEDFESWTGSVVDGGGDHISAQNGWSSDGVVEVRDNGTGGNGSETGSIHHIELNNDPTDTYDDAPNIARSVDTVDGGTYTVTFDYAPRPGYDATVNQIEVVWDGQVVATISADGTSDSALNWQSHTLTLSGDGNPAEIEFREAGTDTDYGRGMMLDNIQMVETLDNAASGIEGGTIDLPDVSASLTDTDGSETLAVTISAIPEGAVLTDGANTFTASSGNTSVDVSGWDMDGMSITTPDNFTGTAALQVTATSTESEGGATASTSTTLNVYVENVEEAATDMALDSTTIAENAAGAVIGALSVTDADVGDTHTFTVSDSRFEVVDGNLKLKDGVSLDHESEATVDVSVTATDSAGLTYTEAFTVNVSDVDETVTLFSENFNGLSNGTQSDNGSSAWSTDDEQTEYGSSSEHGVNNNAYEFSQTTDDSNDNDSVAVWRSEEIDISGQSGVELSFDLTANGDMEESGSWHDFFKAYAVVDGERTELMVQDGDAGMSGTQTFTFTNIPEGEKVTIEFEGKTTSSTESFTLDNVELTSSGGTNVNLGDAGTPDGWTPDDVIYADGGDDEQGSSSDELMIGGSGDNKLEGKDGDDELRGGAGEDELKGGDGDDTLYGGADDDKLKGEDGNDYLDGGSGDDKLEGKDGDDILIGGAGDDELKGGKDDDVLRGGAGDDEMKGEDGNDLFLFGTGDGSDEIEGGGGGWTDTIRLENEDGTSLSSGDWTLTLDDGSIQSQDGDSIDLSEDASGIITLTDGSEISFEGIERIEW